MLVSMKMVDENGCQYWCPHNVNNEYCEKTIALIDSLGYPPDTDAWVEPPAQRGWYTHESISMIIYELTKRNHSVVFSQNGYQGLA